MTTMNIDQLLKSRSNSRSNWCGTDQPSNYRSVTEYGRNLYNETDIVYRFNQHGFRCDNFDIESNFPTLFIGCSITEGIGLPYDLTWAKKLHTEISPNDPFWNLSLMSTGSDTQSRLLYWYEKKNFQKPKVIFGLLPPSTRRELTYQEFEKDPWCKTIGYPTEVNQLFTNSAFAQYQTLRSMMLIDSLARAWGSKVILTFWSYEDASDDHQLIKKEFDHIIQPTIGDWKDINKSWARDSQHWGVEMHDHIFNSFFKSL